jgi:3-phenylpropionate/trans-cinnamate dioxygenase ferredoxin reductase subunit
VKRERIVILGASLSGASAAASLRDGGFDGEIHLIGEEPHVPYNRPPLSKGYLRGEGRFEDQLVHPAGFYGEREITLRLGSHARRIDPRRRVVSLDGGEEISYGRLLVTTGGRNRGLTVPGADLQGILQLRTVEDCHRIRAAARPGSHAVVIGLGFIGSEVTATLRQLGVDVVAVEVDPVPLARVLGKEVGAVLAEIHREGIAPNSELLAAAGAAVDNGVLVDERCRTSLPDVYAAGDVANHLHPIFGRLRVEHWNNGQQQGRAAARSMLGGAEASSRTESCARSSASTAEETPRTRRRTAS